MSRPDVVDGLVEALLVYAAVVAEGVDTTECATEQWYVEELVTGGTRVTRRSAPIEVEDWDTARTERVALVSGEQGRCWACGAEGHYVEDHEGAWADLDTMEALLGLPPLPAPALVEGPGESQGASVEFPAGWLDTAVGRQAEPVLAGRRCGRCRVAFTVDELANADAALHTDPETGEDVHEACCPECSGPPLAEGAEAPGCDERALGSLGDRERVG